MHNALQSSVTDIFPLLSKINWIACLMVVWGVLSTSMLWIESSTGFYVLRFLLGVAEAGFFGRLWDTIRLWFN